MARQMDTMYKAQSIDTSVEADRFVFRLLRQKYDHSHAQPPSNNHTFVSTASAVLRSLTEQLPYL